MRNKRLFEKIARKPQKELKSWLYQQLRNNGYGNPDMSGDFLYAAGTVPVLLVAHLDTVHKEPVKEICWDKSYNTAMSPQGIGGDDRCGVYMILRIIKDLKCHVLFCEDEEIGGLGAHDFATSGITPMVNYIVEFDRKGSNDAVYYDCDNQEFAALLAGYGFVEDYGSFSDISIIAPALKVAAVNISSGYYDAHTRHESINMAEMNENADRIAQLIRENPNTRYEYIRGTGYRGGWHSWKSYYNNDYYGYGCYDGYDYGYDDSYTSTKNSSGRCYIMPLPARNLIVLTRDEQWELQAKDAPFFGIDAYGNLFAREYDDTWSFIENECDIYANDKRGDFIDYDDTKAEPAQVDWFPTAQSADEEKPWSEQEGEVTIV